MSSADETVAVTNERELVLAVLYSTAAKLEELAAVGEALKALADDLSSN